ncbi:MAG: hypothetical protein K9G60_02490 [Pseudolabrys sp.]|nr:hypothetical protein [Pseudolabrys sp.]
MDDDTALHEIARLEDRIEELTESLAWCRKLSAAGKTAVAFGTLWFALILFWILPFSPAAFAGATAALLGGIVLLGSNATTWDQTEAALRQAEAARADLIGRMDLRIVGEQPRLLH